MDDKPSKSTNWLSKLNKKIKNKFSRTDNLQDLESDNESENEAINLAPSSIGRRISKISSRDLNTFPIKSSIANIRSQLSNTLSIDNDRDREIRTSQALSDLSQSEICTVKYSNGRTSRIVSTNCLSSHFRQSVMDVGQSTAPNSYTGRRDSRKLSLIGYSLSRDEELYPDINTMDSDNDTFERRGSSIYTRSTRSNYSSIDRQPYERKSYLRKTQTEKIADRNKHPELRERPTSAGLSRKSKDFTSVSEFLTEDEDQYHSLSDTELDQLYIQVPVDCAF